MVTEGYGLWTKPIYIACTLCNLLFQEIIQNAEDAKATKVVFLIDHTTYGRNAELLYDQRLEAYQVFVSINTCLCHYTLSL